MTDTADTSTLNIRNVPLETILKINAARTIPISRYEEDGCFDRFSYLEALADDQRKDISDVIELAELLGPEEDFDGLVWSAEELL